MDELKLFSFNDELLSSTMKTTNQIASDIGMTFDVNKCVVLSITRKKIELHPPPFYSTVR